jgi:hypothetical protein
MTTYMTSTTKALSIKRSYQQQAGHPPLVNLKFETETMARLSLYEYSRILTDTSSESDNGILTIDKTGESEFNRGVCKISINLSPLSDAMTNEEWFSALNVRIEEVKAAFLAIYPSSLEETTERIFNI